MSTFPLSAQSYSDLWAKVEAAQSDDLPRDVIKTAQQIYDKALREHNFPQLTKAWITMTQNKVAIDPDSFHIASIQPLPHQGTAQTAIYHALLATAHQVMSSSHTIDQNADSVRYYRTRAFELFQSSIADREALANVSAQDYLPLVTLGDDSYLYGHDLLSLLTRFYFDHGNLTSEQEATLAAETAQFYLSHGNREAWALLTLQALEARNDINDFHLRLSDTDYTRALRQLVDDTRSLQTGAWVARAYYKQLSDRDEQMDFLREAQQRYAQSPVFPFFRNAQLRLLTPEVHVDFANDILPNRPFDLKVTYDNATCLKLEVRKYNGTDKNHDLRTDGRLIEQRSFTLADDATNQERLRKGYVTSGSLQEQLSLPAGHYVVIIRLNDQSQPRVQEFQITSLHLSFFQQPDGQVLSLVRNIETGRPVSGALISYSDRSSRKQHEVRTDAHGEALIPEGDLLSASASLPDTDDATSSLYFWAGSPASSDKPASHGQLFTDRAIYRPGQTVHVSGIVYQQHGDHTQTMARYATTVTLYDANHRKLEERLVTTSDLGSFSLDFQLPKEGLPGQYQLTLMGSRLYVRVEEYKRPTFTAEAKAFGAEGREFSFGDSLQVQASAHTYAGVPVQEARVHYTVRTARSYFWRWMGNDDWNTLAEGDLVTDLEGQALIPLYLDPKCFGGNSLSGDDDSRFGGYDRVEYQVEARITDQAGETHDATYSLSLSRKGFALNVELPSQTIDQAAPQTFCVRSVNANGNSVEVQGQYIIYINNVEEPLHQGTFTTGQPIALPALRPGQYWLQASATDQQGHRIAASASFKAFDSRRATSLTSRLKANEASCDVTGFTEAFFFAPSSVVSEQQPARLYFAPHCQDVLVSYMVLCNDRIISRQSLTLGHGLYSLQVPYLTEYGDGFSVLFHYLRDGQFFCKRCDFTYQKPDKRLELSWKTFRDRLTPGQQEQWILNIHRPDGQPVEGAELLASLYDASLDQLYRQPWLFSVNFNRHLTRFNNGATSRNYGTSLYMSLPQKLQNEYALCFDELTEFISPRFYFHENRVFSLRTTHARTGAMMAPKANAIASSMVEDIDMVVCEDDALADVAVLEEASDAGATPSSQTPSIRTNFAETAFFLPHLLSDAQGDVHLSFTLPESLTEWRFMGLAHDQQVNYGQISATTVARREFMVQPNMPRFVREGDHVAIASRLINQGEASLSGTAQLQLIDPETEQVIATQSQPFALEAGATTSVTFRFDVDDRYPMLICEVTAQSGSFGDGERHYLPVLSSRQYVTESVPFFVTPADSVKHIDVSSLFNHGSNTTTHRQLVLEYTEHPEWTLIESLDGIKLPTSDCTPCWAASLYGNLTAQRLAASIPGFEDAVRQALAATQNEPGSPLLDNEELRDLVLTDTPWLNDALQESQQRARLLDLFDGSLMDNRIERARTKLHKLQNHDGSWSWFEGMDGNYYITLATCESLVPLAQDDADLKDMVTRALNYLDQQQLKDYRERVKRKASLSPSASDLDYLYLCSMMPQRRVSTEVEKMRNAYLKQLPGKVSNLTILGRSQIACILQAFGRDREAAKLVESTVQYTVTKPGMGRYFVTDAAYYSWRDYRIPTQLAAMRAIRQSNRTDRESLLSDMTLWLLRQKQTQIWDTPLNTLHAISFLLESTTGMSNQFVTHSSGPQFTLDAQSLDTPIDTTRFLASQLGYIRTTLPAESPEFHTLTIISSDPSSYDNASHLSWGSLSSRFMEDITRLPSRTTGELQVSIQLIPDVKASTDNRTGITTGTLHVGDRITLRITVTADRDMDFVQVHIQRPACLEPLQQLSGYRWFNGRGGYLAQHDASTDLFFDRFTRGSFTYDIPLTVDRSGHYHTGITTAQCAYAPEFNARAASLDIVVE